MSQDDAIVFGGPREHDWIDRASEPDILNPKQDQFGKTKQQTAHDVAVEVFIARQP